MFSSKTYALGATYINRAFQLSGELVVKNSIYGTAKYNSTLIYNWTRAKFEALQIPEYIRSYSKNRMGYDVNIIYDSTEPYFCLKASHPDETVPKRIWTIEAEIVLVNEKLLLGVRLSYSTPISSNVEDVEFSMPGFMREIYRRNGIRDIRQLDSKVWDVKDEEEVEVLYDLIHDSNRKMPVVVITENESEQSIGEQYTKGYLIDADIFSRNVGGIAHVVRMSGEIIEKWNEVAGKQWGVYGGAIRTYFPGADFCGDDYMRHPLSVVNRIMASNYTDREGKEYIAGEAFRCILESNIKRYNTNVRLDWLDLGHKFYFIANRERLEEKEKTISDIDQLKQAYEHQIEQLEGQKANMENEWITAQIQKEAIEEQLEDARNTIYRLNLRVDALEHQLLNSKSENTEIPILDDYSEMQEWVEKYFPGRVCLHSRAVRALKDAVYEDPKLVFEAVKLLGTTYYQMRMGNIPKSDFDKECEHLGIEESGSIADNTAGELGDTYYVLHHGERIKLERHLRKGVSREPQYCMRIYFFWSEKESQVVIGSLPQHLTIRIS